MAYLLVLSVVPDDAREVRSTRPVLAPLLEGWVAERIAEQCLYGFGEVAGLGGEPVGSK